MIWIGTSGFQYPEWKGTFYPEDLSTQKMLAYYSERFATTEINYSFYRVPAVKTLENWANGTPPQFRFSFKAPQQITHIRQLKDVESIMQRFCEALHSIEQKVGVILFQLPPTFKKDTALLNEFLQSIPTDFRCAFEFRHKSWFADDVFESLRHVNVALCIAENEKLSTPVVFTADFGYLRLRREDYNPTDLAHWAELLGNEEEHRKEIFVYFKHEESGVGPKFAKQMIEQLARTNRAEIVAHA